MLSSPLLDKWYFLIIFLTFLDQLLLLILKKKDYQWIKSGGFNVSNPSKRDIERKLKASSKFLNLIYQRKKQNNPHRVVLNQKIVSSPFFSSEITN